MKDSLKIIFLDIDGVLNSEKSCEYHIKNKSNEWLYIAPWIGHIKHLNHIIEKTNAKIVISSTWRTNPYVEMILYLAGLKGDIIGKTPRLPSRIRGEEIKFFLKYAQYDDKGLSKEEQERIQQIKKDILHETNFCGLKIDNFVILDDDTDMLDLTNNFVLVDGYNGLTKKDALKAISILNGE